MSIQCNGSSFTYKKPGATRYCAFCGTKLTTSTYAYKGAEYSDEYIKCNTCGSYVLHSVPDNVGTWVCQSCYNSCTWTSNNNCLIGTSSTKKWSSIYGLKEGGVKGTISHKNHYKNITCGLDEQDPTSESKNFE